MPPASSPGSSASRSQRCSWTARRSVGTMRDPIGSWRRQHRCRQGQRASSGCHCQRHPPVAAGGHLPARRRPARQHHDDPEAQHQGRCRQRIVRAAWGLPQRALRRRLRLLQEKRLSLRDRAERRRRLQAGRVLPLFTTCCVGDPPIDGGAARNLRLRSSFPPIKEVTMQTLAAKDAGDEARPGHAMGRILALAFGAVAYAVFLGAFLYAIGFVSGLVVPKTIDTGPMGSVGEALVIDVLLLTVFALQHSVMARAPFKRWWTQFVPASIERSIYVLLASLALILVFWQWRPIPTIVWEASQPRAGDGADGAVVPRLAARAAQHVPDQPFRAVRAAAGPAQPGRQGCPSRISGRLPLQGRAPPALSGLHHRLLGRAGHDGRPSAVRRWSRRPTSSSPSSSRSATSSPSSATSTGAIGSAWRCWCRSGARRPERRERCLQHSQGPRGPLAASPRRRVAS